MRSLQELISKDDPAWLSVLEWAEESDTVVELLEPDASRASAALTDLQQTTRSVLGAIVYHSGGIFIDHRWIRLLGSGSPEMPRAVIDWNLGKTIGDKSEQPGHLLVADDVIGGFFAINGGDLGEDLGNMYYFSPGTLEWEPLEIKYSEFVDWCFHDDLDDFYDGYRWEGWEEEVPLLNGSQVFSFYPFLWAEEGGSIEKISRKPVPIEEHYRLQMEMAEKLSNTGQ
ncbi:MAG: hypothetical protein RLZZ165_2484 [Bacteroidota bacterium]|jgi:hypothetical protein